MSNKKKDNITKNLLPWSCEQSEKLYGIDSWGGPFFSINTDGHIAVSPFLDKPEKKLDLYNLVNDLKERGLRLPLLVRFPDILQSRIKLLNNCFKSAIADYGYQGSFYGVYPVKVNQERHLVEDLVRLGENEGMGLECGSKPELLIALSKMKNPEGLIICNGFKDSDYIETAMLARKLSRNTIIVVDRYSELKLIIEASKKLNITPRIGLRAKLSSQGAGRWAESSGNKSKFGLSPVEIVRAVNYLKEFNLENSIELLHFHIGSQVPAIQSIKASLKEGARFFTELFLMGVNPKYLDVGGGLGVNYDGSGKSDSSTNYTEQEYANDVIHTIYSICEEKSIPHPNIITESGRALVAHSSMLIFNVLGSNNISNKREIEPIKHKDHQVLRDLKDILDNLNEKNVNEAFNDLVQIKKDVLQMFTYGVLSLKQRARAEELSANIEIKMKSVLENTDDKHELTHTLDKILCENYFSNFSVFQSLPDSWAMEQVFPVMPIHRLNEKPERRAVIVDLTCDSDGMIDNFIDPTSEETQNYLEVHTVKKGEPYLMGVFLTGAYQEILGDLHNLFGDTDAVHISLDSNGTNNYRVGHYVKGDSIAEVLKYVSYSPSQLLETLQEDCETAIGEGQLKPQQARILMRHFEESLYGYTYLDNDKT